MPLINQPQENAYSGAEKQLHLLSLFGGWPGAVITQQQLRHKSSKWSFQRLFSLTVIINSLFFVYLLMPHSLDTLIKLQSIIAL